MNQPDPLPIVYADIERALMHDRARRSTVLPRFTPPAWWECDVCEVTESGYLREYEIKMSRADFKVDAAKTKEVFPRPYGEPPKHENKHDLLAAGDVRGPVQFWFVTPAGLLKPEEIPAWAGLLEVYRPDHSHHCQTREVIYARRLHREKCAPSLVGRMTQNAYNRLHSEWADAYWRSLNRRIHTPAADKPAA